MIIIIQIYLKLDAISDIIDEIISLNSNLLLKNNEAIKNVEYKVNEANNIEEKI